MHKDINTACSVHLVLLVCVDDMIVRTHHLVSDSKLGVLSLRMAISPTLSISSLLCTFLIKVEPHEFSPFWVSKSIVVLCLGLVLEVILLRFHE